MAPNSTLFRFQIILSNVDQGTYETLEFRAALHPSESISFFVIRILAFCLNYQEGLEFSGGISEPDSPAIRVSSLTGPIDLWIDIGTPSAKRLHKAAKVARQVKIYTHKNLRPWIEELKKEKVYKLGELGIYSINEKFLKSIGETLERENRWEITLNEGELYMGVGDKSFQSRVETYTFDVPPE